MAFNGKKVLLWSGGGLGGIVVIAGVWILILWIGAGSTYEGRLESLVPQNALVVARLNNLDTNLPRLRKGIESVLDRRGLAALEAAPTWRSLTAGENGGPPLSLSARYDDLKHALTQVEQSLAALPMLNVNLLEDVAGREVCVALIGDASKGSLSPLLLTRVSQSLAFGWSFKGFGEGRQGNSTIEIRDDALVLTRREGGESQATWLMLLDDVLVASTNPEVVEMARQLHQPFAARRPFHRHPQFPAAEGALKDPRAALRVFANLDALRDYQGPDQTDARKRATLDQVFSLPRSVMQISSEVMPAINTVFERSIDTRVFGMAAWSVNLDDASAVALDQYLLADPERLSREPHLARTWGLAPVPMDFLAFLPKDTWLVGTLRQPMEVVKEAIQPDLDELGNPRPSAVWSFLQSMGPNPPIDSIGMAFLPQELAPPAGYAPPGLISQAQWPAFALFMHWPGVTLERIMEIMRDQLRDQGATKIKETYDQTPEKDRFVTFQLLEHDEKIRFVSQFAAFALKDYFIFTYSKNNGAVREMFRLAKDGKESLARAARGPWTALPGEHSALVYVNPEGLRNFSVRANLPAALADAKFTRSQPEGMESVDFRRMIAEQLREDIRGDRVSLEYERRVNEWMARHGPFRQSLERDIDAATGLLDFTAHSGFSAERLHTRFLLRLK